MTDRQLLRQLGRSLSAAASVAVLLVCGIAYGEITYPAPTPVVDSINAR